MSGAVQPAVQAVSPVCSEERILVLQGGGALGAYQAGAYEGLAMAGYQPEWLAGISIGAVNAALIAGNPPERRLERLKAFWDMVSEHCLDSFTWLLPDGPARRMANELSAMRSAAFGCKGFFQPRLPVLLPIEQPPSVLGFYDSSPLRASLEALVDFDLINEGPIRLSVGAVNVRTGNFLYFDNRKQRLDARHIMASAALPPGLPPIEIDGEYFWDGSLVSNTPLDYVLMQPGERDRLVFQVDLFPSRGALPNSMGDVLIREKDIRYSSRTRLNTDLALRQRALAQTARKVLAKLPKHMQDDPELAPLREIADACALTVMHLIYRQIADESQSKEFEFSRVSVTSRWENGLMDVACSLADPAWQGRVRGQGVQVFDLTREKDC